MDLKERGEGLNGLYEINILATWLSRKRKREWIDNIYVW